MGPGFTDKALDHLLHIEERFYKTIFRYKPVFLYDNPDPGSVTDSLSIFGFGALTFATSKADLYGDEVNSVLL